MSLLFRMSVSVNHIAKQINSTGRAYSVNLAEIKDEQNVKVTLPQLISCFSPKYTRSGIMELLNHEI